MLTPAIRAIFASLALPLLVARVGANDAHDAVTPDDLAVAADFLDRCQYFHLFRPENDPRARQVVRRQLDRYLVARQDLDVVHSHLSRNMAERIVIVFEFHANG